MLLAALLTCPWLPSSVAQLQLSSPRFAALRTASDIYAKSGPDQAGDSSRMAEELFQNLEAVRRASPGREYSLIGWTFFRIAEMSRLRGDVASATPAYDEALAILDQGPPTDVRVGPIYRHVGWQYQSIGRFARAEQLYLRAIEIDVEGAPWGELTIAEDYDYYAEVLHKMGRDGEAAQYEQRSGLIRAGAAL